ncbi:hypothetical protein FHS14_005432 [Paenibacillus baekrokdamisoli]|nr:hypothetical protein [Paenibacillus baekrokdamisoli]
MTKNAKDQIDLNMTYAVHSNRWKTINSHRNVN